MTDEQIKNNDIVKEKTTSKKKTKMEHVGTFFGNVMSVDETRISVLMLCLMGTLIFGGDMYYTNATIDSHWVDIIETLIYCVTGINVANTINKNGFFNKNTNEMPPK